MTSSTVLQRCVGCDLHIHGSEQVCPFCGAAQTASPRLRSRSLRAGVLAVTVAGALGISACAYGCPPLPDGGTACGEAEVDSGVSSDLCPAEDGGLEPCPVDGGVDAGNGG